MPTVKVNDNKKTSKVRKKELWELLGNMGIQPHRIHDGNNAYFVIVNQEEVEKILSEKTTQNLMAKDYKVLTPIEHNASKTIIIRRLDAIIDEYNDEELVESLETNNEWLKLEDLYRFETTAKIIKIRCQSITMVDKAVAEGLFITNQRVKPSQVEREIFIKITPCNNCFCYDHTTNRCPHERLTLCSNCGANDHRNKNCKVDIHKCLNCGGPHRTLAATCSVRKNIMKDKRTELRARSRSRTRNIQAGTTTKTTTDSSYRNAASQGTGAIPKMEKNEMKVIVTKVVSAVVYSHYMEAMQPGTFQRNMDEIFKKNGLPRVLFPTEIDTENVMEVFRDITREEEERQIVDELEKEKEEEMETISQSNKRGRESTSPQHIQEVSQQQRK